MNVLEKILEEMKKIKDGNRKDKLYAKYPPKCYKQEILNAYSQGYEDGTDNFYNAMISFICSHMDEVENGGWIPCSERLPNEEELAKAYVGEDAAEFLATIEGATLPTTLYFKNGSWTDMEGNYYNVVAWQPLPEPYKGEEAAGE